MARFKKQPCAYCGQSTGKNEREHVIPRCLYPSNTPLSVQRATVPACPDCNGSWEADEGHFKTIVSMTGSELTPERVELFGESLRGFKRSVHGEQALMHVYRQMISTQILDARGRPWYRVRPHEDPRVTHVIKKIVRGLSWRCTETPLEDSRVVVLANQALPPFVEAELSTVYEVPRVFVGRAMFFCETLMWRHLHSFWVLQFFNGYRIAAMANGPEPDAPLPEVR